MNTQNPSLAEPRAEKETTYDRVHQALAWLNQRIVGQEDLTKKLTIALICGGHLLVEGAPGLAKTRAIKELSRCIEGDFHRIQFTPDLLPSDVTGTEIFRSETSSFHFQHGPIFHNLVLADEVNRAPAKVQSALLEAMAERQVTVGRETFTLPRLFLVMATQNPIEQEGTYPLPEAQLDRFLMHVLIDYPPASQERAILHLARDEFGNVDHPPPVELGEDEILDIRAELGALYMADSVERYIVDLVAHSRSGMEGVEYAASPRATIALDQCARTLAWLAGRDYVVPEDVLEIAHDVFRHRLILSFEAEAKGTTTDDVIDTMIEQVTLT
ncbi:MAG: AAA domain-containing protein [Gammaproteobacteria bacterium]|nr:AAA domain-containing protein [Gammaproteobacteria bacterium]